MNNLLRCIGVIGSLCLLLVVPQAQADARVRIQSVAFSHCPEMEPAFLLKTEALRNQAGGALSPWQELQTYQNLYQNCHTEMPFVRWSAQGGAHPKLFRIHVRVFNEAPVLSEEMPITLVLYAKVGQYYVEQKAFLPDRKHLAKTARWVRFLTLRDHLPQLASREIFDYFSAPIPFGQSLLQLNHRFPVALKAKIMVPHPKQVKTLEIPIQPDHFAVDDLQH